MSGPHVSRRKTGGARISSPHSAPRRDSSFTLVEMLVAIAILTVLFVLAAQVIARTSSIWLYSTSKMSQSREARVAFNSLTSRLSKATVDQYYGYTNYNAGTSAAPVYVPGTYVRRSEVRFISGPSSTVCSNLTATATHSVFFVAPLGIVSDTADYSGLPSLLNVCGYYIQWTNVDLDRPAILPGTGIYRFRLMQFVQPAEQMSVYSQTIPNAPTPAYSPSPGPAVTGGGAGNAPTYSFVTTSPSWEITAMNNSSSGIRQLANNVIALLLLPARNFTDTSGTISPGFTYNSEIANSNPAISPLNRTPPVMRVVMYTLDDKSAQKLTQSATVPNLYVDTSNNPLFIDPTKLFPVTSPTADIGDLARFEASLSAKKLTYRRFDATVELPRQPWNTQN
jgi:uncharacterized protein (TIGR02599 family)